MAAMVTPLADVTTCPDERCGYPNLPTASRCKNCGRVLRATPVVTCVADVVAERVRWLWPGRLPAGKAIVLDGDPGLGKSSVTLDLAARISTGASMPDGAEPLFGPRAVVVLSAEDGVADTLRPRLDALGANLELVHVLEGILDVSQEERPASLPDDLAVIESVVIDRQAALVIVDPLMAYLGGSIDSHRDQDVRTAMSPLAKIAERTGACFLLVRHLRKGNIGARAIYSGGGSIGIIGAARVGLLIAADPEDESGQRRILAVVKNNLAAHPPALAYRLISHEPLDVPRVAWDGTTDHRPDDLLGPPVDQEARSALDEACDVLADILSAGPCPAKAVIRDAQDAGISVKTLRRAKKKLGVTSLKTPEGWVWQITPRGQGGQRGLTENGTTCEDGQGAHTYPVGTLATLAEESDGE